MKSIITTIFAFTIVLISSCSNDDNALRVSDPLHGSWNLSNVTGGFAGVDIDYEHESVSWNFNQETLILTVEATVINSSPQSSFLPIQNGQYEYSILESNGNEYLIIEGISIYENGEYGRLEINETGDLFIDQSESSIVEAADVYLLSFIR